MDAFYTMVSGNMRIELISDISHHLKICVVQQIEGKSSRLIKKQMVSTKCVLQRTNE